MTMPSCVGDLAVVAVAPDAGKLLEVRGAVLGAVGIVPEADRHRGKRARADELALLAVAPSCPASSNTSTSRPRPGTGSRRATPGSIGLPSTKHETMSVPPEIDDEAHVALHVLGTRSRSLRARAASRSRGWRAARSRRCVSPGFTPGLGERVDELRGGAEVRHAFGVGVVEQDVAAADERRAVVEQERRVRGQRRTRASSTSSSRSVVK